MSNEKVQLKLNKKKKKQENITIEPALLEALISTHISVLNKPSNKFPKAKFVCKICPYHMDDVDRAIKHAQDNIHKRNLNKLCTKNLLTYLPNPTKVQIEAVNECLENTLKEPIFITDEEYRRRFDICIKMNELVAEINPGNRLVICGSLLTGLSLTSASDVNLFLDTESKNTKNTGYLSELNKLSKTFKNKLNLKTEVKLEKNNCGLFCKDKQGVLYHVSASNRLQHLSSELIRLYLKLDKRAENLAKLLRYFANKAFIDQVKDGLFPSEAFPILVIFYLQQLTIPILPNLHKLAEIHLQDLTDVSVSRVNINDTQLNYVNDISWIKRLWTPLVNEMSLAELWIGLLKFYVVEFNSCSYMVSIRCTQPVLKSERHIINRRLAIENPFDVKRNILFHWNTTDVTDFLNDQLQGCFIYFAVPQLEKGPAFKKVSFLEISLANLKSVANVTPIFTKDNFFETIEMIEMEFKKLYTEQKSYYDVTKWPVELFVKACLSKILTSVFNSATDIKNLICLLELKTKNDMYFPIENYVKFKDYALRLSKCVLQEFSDFFEKTNSWSQQDFENKQAYELIKKSSQKFINESLNISNNDDEDDEFEDLPDSDINEMDETTDREFIIEDVEEIDLLDNNNDIPHNGKGENLQIRIQDSESWKLPIAFKQIYVNIKGIALSSDNHEEYNEDQINSLKKQDLVFSFNKISIHDKKLVFTCTLCNTKGHRKENCNYAIPRFDELQDAMTSINIGWLTKLNTALNEKYKAIVPNNDRTKVNEKIFGKITEIVKTLYPTSRPQLFGSTINGFITKASDLDICLEFYVDDKRQSLSNKDVTTRLRTIGREIKKLDGVIRVDYILKAKVPIIKFYMKNNVQGDISINNSLGLQNTKMLKLYADISQGVKLLGNLIKFMAKTCEIGDASQGTLSSYAYMLMLIHFLQKRGVLPVLQELYEGDRPTQYIDGWDAWYQSDFTTIHKLWNKKSCNERIEHLWLDFFYYYTVEFDIDKEVVTIRQSEPLFKIDKNWQSAYMAVEDPFNLSHNLCGSLSLENCRYILECFAHVLKLHSNFDNLFRPDGASYKELLEPTLLRPQVVNSRICFTCNKQGHVARDCVDRSNKRTPTKPSVPSQSSLPSLTAPLQFKPSNVASRVYLQSELIDSTDTENIVPYNIPLKDFKADVNQFSVVPFSMKFGDKTVIVPMLVGKNDIIEKKLNSLLINGLNNNVCVFPIETVKQIDSVKQIEEIYQNNSPVNAFRRQTPNKNEMPVSNNYNKFPQPQMSRNPMVQHNMPQRMSYDIPVRMMVSPQNNMPRYNNNYNYPIPPGYHYQSENMRPYSSWNYVYPDVNRRLMRTPTNNNHTPRGNRK